MPMHQLDPNHWFPTTLQVREPQKDGKADTCLPSIDMAHLLTIRRSTFSPVRDVLTVRTAKSISPLCRGDLTQSFSSTHDFLRLVLPLGPSAQTTKDLLWMFNLLGHSTPALEVLQRPSLN